MRRLSESQSFSNSIMYIGGKKGNFSLSSVREDSYFIKILK